MDTKFLQKLLIDVAEGRITPCEAAEKLKTLPYYDIDFAKLDTHRALRTGRAEVVFGIGKTPEQVATIMKRLSADMPLVIATKAERACYEAVKEEIPAGIEYYETAKLLVYRAQDENRAQGEHGAQDEYHTEEEHRAQDEPARTPPSSAGHVAVVCAGTADIPIAEEAALTSELYGVQARRYYDVGVAGIHRLMDKLDDIRGAKAIVVVAGMEGALSSVLGGLVDVPVIAVPTSIGYGASMGGLAALLAMLNSCSLGVSVVNIDNGFGAGYQASMIVKGKG